MKLVIGNQKSYLNKDTINNFVNNINEFERNNVILCPSDIFLTEFNKTNILLGSQNISIYDNGAFTGEISVEQIKSLGVNFSIVGHSERRELFGETIEDTNIKIKKLLDNKIIPILCIGESKEEKENGQTKEVILKELLGAFKNVDNNLIEKVIIAYEPIWSIGTGIIPTNEEIENISKYIRDFIRENYNSYCILLYGGSVNLKNIDELNKIEVVDGYLIGGASTKVDDFIEIIKKCS